MKWVLIVWTTVCGPQNAPEHIGACAGSEPTAQIFDTELSCLQMAKSSNEHWNLRAKCVARSPLG
jgi:hypothetical protein